MAAPPKHEFRAERFKLPYALPPMSAQRPTITGIVGGNNAVSMGGTITLSFTGTVTRASLMSPAAVTHQSNMNQRALNLRVVAAESGQVTVTMPPPGGRVAPAGQYMLFLLNGDIPCTQATWVRLVDVANPAGISYPSSPLVANLAPLPEASTGFESAQTTTWVAGVYGPARATTNLRDAAAARSGSFGATVTVTTPGAESWQVQLASRSLPLKADTLYTAGAWVRSNVAVSIPMNLVRDGDYLTFGTTRANLVPNTWTKLQLEDIAVPVAANFFWTLDLGSAPANTRFQVDDIWVGDSTRVLPGQANPPLPEPAEALPEIRTFSGPVFVPIPLTISPTPSASPPPTITTPSPPPSPSLAPPSPSPSPPPPSPSSSPPPPSPPPTPTLLPSPPPPTQSSGTVIPGASSNFESGSVQPFQFVIGPPAAGSISLTSTTGAFAGSRCALVRVTTAAPAEPWKAQILMVSGSQISIVDSPI